MLNRGLRIDKDNYYLNIAEAVSQRASCLRRKFGVVLVNNDRIISTGYNGSVKGDINCCDISICKRNSMNMKSGEGYEFCRAVHAEQNALLSVSRNECIGASIYLVGIDCATNDYYPIGPCYLCLKLIKAMEIHNIIIRVTKDIYETRSTMEL